MIVTVEQWIFDVDMPSTMAYSAQEALEHCVCGNCRNFYAAVDREYPQLRPFLAQFGLDIEAPEHMSPIEFSSQRIDYDPEYYVFGKVIRQGAPLISVGNCHVCVPDWDGEIGGEAAFALNVDGLSLPWVLDEPFQEAPVAKRNGFWRKFFN